MSINRRAAKRDDAERPIIDALEKIGATVTQLSGTGVPDLLVCYQGVNHLMEVKGSHSESLTDDQEAWWDRNERQSGPLALVTTPEEAIQALRATRRERRAHVQGSGGDRRSEGESAFRQRMARDAAEVDLPHGPRDDLASIKAPHPPAGEMHKETPNDE